MRSGALDAPLDGSGPPDFDIGTALSLYGFPESADWRALGQVVELRDAVGRQRIQQYVLALADHMRRRLAERFGESCLLQPTVDARLKSALVAFSPFRTPQKRRDLAAADAFTARTFYVHGYRLGHGGLDRRGLTRPPEPDAAAFYPGWIPNRHLVTGAPDPSDVPIRANACVWRTRGNIDAFVDARVESARDQGAGRAGAGAPAAHPT